MMNVYSIERMIIHIMFNVIVENLQSYPWTTSPPEILYHKWHTIVKRSFNKEIITNAEYYIDKNFEEATIAPQGKLQ